MFLKDLNLFSIFIVDRPVYDIAGAFDQEFKFMDSFKTPVTDVFQPLRKKLEKADAIVQTAHNSLNINTVANTQLQVENLRQKINDLLPKIELIRKTRENCFKDKHSVVTGVNARETLMAEKEKLTMELETMSRSHKMSQTKKDKLEEVIKEIDKVLVDLSHGMEGIVSPTAKEYIDKKLLFKQEIDYIDTSLADYKRIISDLAIRIKSITEELEKIDGYTTADTEVIDNKITRLNKEQEELYSILTGLEGALKQQTDLLHTSSVKLEQADSYMNAAVQNVEDTAIVSHLSTPAQPISVTTVMNYLRYYYFYHSTLIAKDLLTAYDTDVYTAQAIACKLVLMRNFGLYLHQMISYAEFMDNRLGTVISIVKD
jgi:hypothetical protein